MFTWIPRSHKLLLKVCEEILENYHIIKFFSKKEFLCLEQGHNRGLLIFKICHVYDIVVISRS